MPAATAMASATPTPTATASAAVARPKIAADDLKDGAQKIVQAVKG